MCSGIREACDKHSRRASQMHLEEHWGFGCFRPHSTIPRVSQELRFNQHVEATLVTKEAQKP